MSEPITITFTQLESGGVAIKVTPNLNDVPLADWNRACTCAALAMHAMKNVASADLARYITTNHGEAHGHETQTY